MKQIVADFERAQAAIRDLSSASKTRCTILIEKMKIWRREHARTSNSTSKAGFALRTAQLATQRVETKLKKTQKQIAQLKKRI